MSDTDIELREGTFLEYHNLSVCTECHRVLEAEEMTKDLGDLVCTECHEAASRKCVLCGNVVGHWYGMQMPSGFICDDHITTNSTKGGNI